MTEKCLSPLISLKKPSVTEILWATFHFPLSLILGPEKITPGMYPLSPTPSTEQDRVSWMHPKHTLPWIIMRAAHTALHLSRWLLLTHSTGFLASELRCMWCKMAPGEGIPWVFWIRGIFQLIYLLDRQQMVGSIKHGGCKQRGYCAHSHKICHHFGQRHSSKDDDSFAEIFLP